MDGFPVMGIPNRGDTAWMLASAALVLAASAHAQSGKSAAPSATAQPGDGDQASQRWHLMPQMHPVEGAQAHGGILRKRRQVF